MEGLLYELHASGQAILWATLVQRVHGSVTGHVASQQHSTQLNHYTLPPMHVNDN